MALAFIQTVRRGSFAALGSLCEGVRIPLYRCKLASAMTGLPKDHADGSLKSPTGSFQPMAFLGLRFRAPARWLQPSVIASSLSAGISKQVRISWTGSESNGVEVGPNNTQTPLKSQFARKQQAATAAVGVGVAVAIGAAWPMLVAPMLVRVVTIAAFKYMARAICIENHDGKGG